MKVLPLHRAFVALLSIVIFSCHKQIKPEDSNPNEVSVQNVRVYVAGFLEIPIERVTVDGNWIYIENTDVKMNLDSMKVLYLQNIEYKKLPIMK